MQKDMRYYIDLIENNSDSVTLGKPFFSVDYNRKPRHFDQLKFRETVSQFERWQQSASLGGLGDMSHRANDIARELWQQYTQIPQEGSQYTDAETIFLSGDWDKAVDIVSRAMRMSSDQAKRLKDSLDKYELTGKHNQ